MAAPFSASPLVACYPVLVDVPDAQPWLHTLDLGDKLPEMTTATFVGFPAPWALAQG